MKHKFRATVGKSAENVWRIGRGIAFIDPEEPHISRQLRRGWNRVIFHCRLAVYFVQALIFQSFTPGFRSRQGRPVTQPHLTGLSPLSDGNVVTGGALPTTEETYQR